MRHCKVAATGCFCRERATLGRCRVAGGWGGRPNHTVWTVGVRWWGCSNNTKYNETLNIIFSVDIIIYSVVNPRPSPPLPSFAPVLN